MKSLLKPMSVTMYNADNQTPLSATLPVYCIEMQCVCKAPDVCNLGTDLVLWNVMLTNKISQQGLVTVF